MNSTDLFTIGQIPDMSKASTNRVGTQLTYAREHEMIPRRAEGRGLRRQTGVLPSAAAVLRDVPVTDGEVRDDVGHVDEPGDGAAGMVIGTAVATVMATTAGLQIVNRVPIAGVAHGQRHGRRATSAEISLRRAEVLRLRLTGLSESEIGRQLRVSAPTVSRDLLAIQQTWAEFDKGFDGRAEIGESIARLRVLESSAMRELARLERENGPTNSKMRCLWAACGMRRALTDLLLATGRLAVVSDAPPALSLRTAAQIREAFRAARVDPTDLISEGERDWLPLPSTEGTPTPPVALASDTRKG